MSRRTKLILIGGALALVAAGTLAFVLTNIDWLVKSSIEHYGSAVTKTSVRVSSVSIKLLQGSGAIDGLTVANPQGFLQPYILSLDSISVRIEPRSVASPVVVIDNVRIFRPRVAYEVNNARVSNVDALKKNMESSSEPRQPGRTPEGKPTAGKEKRLRIRKLVIENASVDVHVAGLGGKTQTVTLHRIEMTDIGGRAGATPEQVAKQVLYAIAGEVTNEVAQAGAKQLLQRGVTRALEQYRGR